MTASTDSTPGDARQVSGDYLRRNPTWHVEDSPWKAAQITGMLARHRLEPRTVADIGCGAGVVLRELHRVMPPDVAFAGYEPSPHAFALCRELATDRLQFIQGALRDGTPAYDLVLLIDVIEHVEDLFGFLRDLRGRGRHTLFHIPLDLTAYRVLRRGLMEKRRAIGHIHYFTKETALATLRETGYDVIRHAYTPYWRDLPAANDSLAARMVLRPVQRLLWRGSPDLAVTVLGGASLMVLAA